MPERLKKRLRQFRAVGPRQLLADHCNGLTFRFGTASKVDGSAHAVADVDGCLAVIQEHFPGGLTQLRSEITSFVEYARRSSPATLLEIGSATSGNAFLLAQTLPSLEQMICLDLHVRNRHQLRALTRSDVDVRVVDGSSHRAEALDAVRSALGGRPLDLLFIDGDHSFGGVFLDFFLYRDLVRPGGLIAFHDIVPDDRLRSGEPRLGAYVGEVPALWARLKGFFPTQEFVESWEQEGLGIGVVEHDPEVELHPLDLVL